jgi:hypothetical protein
VENLISWGDIVPESQSVQELSNFPYASFVEFQQALKSGDVALGIERIIPYQLVSAGALSQNAYYFSMILSWCFVWVAIPMIALSWSTMEWWSLGLIPLGWISTLISRPWSTPLIILAVIIATGYWGFYLSMSTVAWYGMAWIIMWFLTCGLFNWCSNKVNERLRTDEQFFIKLWPTKVLFLKMKSGETLWPDMA